MTTSQTTVSVKVTKTGKKDHSRAFKIEVFGETYYFGWFAGVKYRDGGTVMLSWSGHPDEPVKVTKLI